MMRFLLGLLLSSVFAWACASSINVNPLSLPFATGGPRYHDITVYNTGKTTAYVSVQLTKIVNPGEKKLTQIPLKENPMGFGLIASPNKLIIPVGESRVVRVLRLLHGNKTEQVYHVNIAPATGVLENIKTSKKVDAGVRVIVGYNVNVLLEPANPKVDIKMVRKGKLLTVTNSGNASALLYRGKQCVLEKCTVLPTKRMYSGLTWITQLKTASSAQYTERFKGKNRVIYSN